MFGVAAEVGLPVTSPLAIGNAGRRRSTSDALRMVEKANAKEERRHTGQIFPRPIGLVLGLRSCPETRSSCIPSYRGDPPELPLAERVAEMRKPEVRERILTDTPAGDGHPLMFAAQAWDYMYPLGDPPRTSRGPRSSVGARARAREVSPLEEALRPPARRRWSRHVAGHAGQLPRPVAGHRGRVDPAR